MPDSARQEGSATTYGPINISVERSYVFQDPREIKTKFRKPIETTFLPVGEDITAIMRDWVGYLTVEKLYGPNDPLFPKTAVQPDEHRSFAVRGLTREHWANAPGPSDFQNCLCTREFALCQATLDP